MNNNIYIIERIEDIKKQIDLLINNTTINIKKPFVFFDIHKTTLNKYTELDKQIYCLIKNLLTKTYNIFFLSFDGQEPRIFKNNDILNKYYIYRKIPKIFIKKRKKQLILDYFYNNLKINNKLILIDDNIKNIKDIKQLCNKKIKAYHYQQIEPQSIQKLYDFLKILQKQKVTKKQIKYNNKLQNQIKINMSLFRKGKYKSKKQAIAISYSQINNKKLIC
jgi:hypothetical protein